LKSVFQNINLYFKKYFKKKN